jgi:hypothetical protein
MSNAITGKGNGTPEPSEEELQAQFKKRVRADAAGNDR